MNKNEISAGTAADKRTAADSIPSASLEQNGVLAEVPDMTFEHDYARRKSTHRIVYIEYIGGQPHSVTTDKFDGYQHQFDFMPDCKECELFMFYNAGMGGKITELQAPHFVKEGAQAAYWMHPKAKYNGKTKAINAVMLDKPIEYNGNPNPFENGREIYGQDYCKFCEKWYDEDACPEHHVVNDEGELEAEN